MIWPQSWIDVTSCLPDLSTVVLYAYDNERKALGSRREARDGESTLRTAKLRYIADVEILAFGLSLQAIPSAVMHASLTYLSEPPANQFFEPPNLATETLGYDIFSHELGLFSQRLVNLILEQVKLDLVDFFHCGSDTSWPHLETIIFTLTPPACADGTWYFAMDTRIDPDEYEEDSQAHTLDDMREYMEEDELPAAMDVPENPFRLAMDPAKFKEIHLAVAQAVKRMPKLRELEDASACTVTIERALGSTSSCLLYTSPSPRDGLLSRMPSSA